MTSPPNDRTDAGFTIIEVLVALALVSVSIIAIGAVMGVKTRGVRALEQHVALMQAVRTLMTVGIPPRAQLQPGTSTGQAAGYRWTIDVSPLGGGWTVKEGNAPWAPELVRIRVKSPSGALSDIRTVRLMPRPSQ
ncbi:MULTISPECIES: prepilin-type N-terminal cleavage/methylation domain-containing protein [unclassified Bradyrhizobium]|uniref:prepilin-type N-terminal cleavage/methylation domain-containing protein n=1 Tax=unclassified Bradyrhizobium TaxID=2631580 RepID=UPI00339332B3